MHTEKFVNLTNNLCFKKVFSNKIILEDFINSFFKYLGKNITYEYSDIEFESAIMPHNKNIKSYYGDIIITLNNGDIINLEMYKDNFTKQDYNKSYSYMCRLYSNQMKVKDNNYENNKKVISLNLIKGNFRQINNSIVNTYNFRNTITDKIIDDGNTEMYLVRFDLTKKVSYNLFNERFIKWLKLINSESLEEMQEIGSGDEIMENSIRVVDEWNKTHRYTWDDYVEVEKARAKYAGKQETAKKFLLAGTPLETVMEVTGLTKEEIENI